MKTHQTRFSGMVSLCGRAAPKSWMRTDSGAWSAIQTLPRSGNGRIQFYGPILERCCTFQTAHSSIVVNTLTEATEQGDRHENNIPRCSSLRLYGADGVGPTACQAIDFRSSFGQAKPTGRTGHVYPPSAWRRLTGNRSQFEESLLLLLMSCADFKSPAAPIGSIANALILRRGPKLLKPFLQTFRQT
jgi:hypothetical protein